MQENNSRFKGNKHSCSLRIFKNCISGKIKFNDGIAAIYYTAFVVSNGDNKIVIFCVNSLFKIFISLRLTPLISKKKSLITLTRGRPSCRSRQPRLRPRQQSRRGSGHSPGCEDHLVHRKYPHWKEDRFDSRQVIDKKTLWNKCSSQVHSSLVSFDII